MNIGAVLQTIAAGEAADGPRVSSRQDAPPDGNQGFRNLLLKFAANQDQRDGPPQGEGTLAWRAANAIELLDWLRSNAEMAGPPAGDDQQPPQPDIADSLDSVDVDALLEALNSGDSATALAALATRVGAAAVAAAAFPAGSKAETGPALTPEKIILAAIASVRAEGKVAAEPAQPEGQTINATLTVVGRETHLAPTETVKSASAGSQWALDLATRRSLAAMTNTPPDPPSGGEMASPAVREAVLPRAGVSAATDARFGPFGGGTNNPAGHSAGVALATSDAVASSDTLLAADAAGTATPAAGRADGNLAPGLMHQIADRVAQEAGTAAAEATRHVPTNFVVKPENAVKVLYLQLQPADLGTVTIRMSVKDNALKLDLEVGRGETAHLIQRERDALSALLRVAGYSIDGLDVRLADQAGLGTQGGGQSGLQMQGGQSGSSQAESRLPGERPQDERRGNSFGNRSEGDEERAGQDRGRGGIYL